MIRLLLLWQLVVAIAVGVFVAAFFGWTAGLSAAVGGLICWLPNCWFAWRAFRHRGARAARQIVRSFYAGQAGKMLLSAGLFTLAFVWMKPLSPLALFLGYGVVQLVNWVVPLVVSSSERQAR